jgi:hypothetical protein
MKTSALQRILFTERVQRHRGAIYFMKEESVSATDVPFVVSTTSGSFVLVNKRTKDGTVRYALSTVQLEVEDLMVRRLFDNLLAMSVSGAWMNRSSSVSGAVDRMSATGFPARSVVLPRTSISEACSEKLSDEDISKRMDLQGYVVKIGTIQIVVGDLPDGCAMVATSPVLTGQYTRVYDSVGLFIRNADKSIYLVTP